MFNAEVSLASAAELGGILCSAYQLHQASDIFQKEKERTHALHSESIDLAKEQHDRDVLMVKQTYLMDVYINLEQHFQQLNADLISSSKESERDIFDQRNQQLQTIILSSSVMFSALSTVIIQGFLPRDAGQFLFILYALLSALSFSFLFLSIVLCIEVISRASKFMYKKAQCQTVILVDAIKETAQIMRRIREITSGGKRAVGGNLGLMKSTGDVQEEWERHEDIVQSFLSMRENINNKSADYVKDPEKHHFESFWVASCKGWGDLAILCFYAGSICLLGAILVFMWCQFRISDNSLAGAVIAVSIIGVSLVTGVALIFYLRMDSTGFVRLPSSSASSGDVDSVNSSPSSLTDMETESATASASASASVSNSNSTGRFRTQFAQEENAIGESAC